jgi:hypothetical protein
MPITALRTMLVIAARMFLIWGRDEAKSGTPQVPYLVELVDVSTPVACKE